MKLVLLSQDLMIGARVEGAARQHGLTTVTVSDQPAALEAVSENDCQLLFLDLKLPS